METTEANETPKTDTFGFDPEVQAKILALLIWDPFSLGSGLSVIKPDSFDNPIDQDIAAIICLTSAKFGQGLISPKLWFPIARPS